MGVCVPTLGFGTLRRLHYRTLQTFSCELSHPNLWISLKRGRAGTRHVVFPWPISRYSVRSILPNVSPSRLQIPKTRYLPFAEVSWEGSVLKASREYYITIACVPLNSTPNFQRTKSQQVKSATSTSPKLYWGHPFGPKWCVPLNESSHRSYCCTGTNNETRLHLGCCSSLTIGKNHVMEESVLIFTIKMRRSFHRDEEIGRVNLPFLCTSTEMKSKSAAHKHTPNLISYRAHFDFILSVRRRNRA